MDGSSGSGNFMDYSKSGLTVTPYGSVLHSNTQVKFGETSGYFPGVATGLLLPGEPCEIASHDFTTEGWFYLTSTAGSYTPLWSHRLNDSAVGGTLLAKPPGSALLFWVCNSGGTLWEVNAQPSGCTWDLNVWTHYAICRQGNSFMTFQNGIKGTTLTKSGTVYTAGNFAIMAGSGSGSTSGSQGYNAGFRHTVGVCRYTDNFQPPLLQFPKR
jgi:hypothetical protein